MAYIMLEGYLCERCGYRWGARSGTGYRPKVDPNYCPMCKSNRWNIPRQRATPPEHQAKPWHQKKAAANLPK